MSLLVRKTRHFENMSVIGKKKTVLTKCQSEMYNRVLKGRFFGRRILAKKRFKVMKRVPANLQLRLM